MRQHRVVSCLIALVVLATANVAHSTTGTWSPSTGRVLPFYPSTPYGLREHASVYDPKRNRVYVFGGIDPNVTGPAPCLATDPEDWCGYKNELWSLDVSYPNPVWQQVPDCPSPPCLRPSHRARASMIYDPESDRVLVFSGYHPDSTRWNGALWEFPLSQPSGWNPLPVGPGGPWRFSEQDMDVRAVLDTARRRLLVIRPDQGVFAIGLSGGAWTQVYNGRLDGLIGARGYGAVYDSNSDRLLIFGGRNIGSSLFCAYDYYSTAYALSLVPGSTWETIATGAPAVAEGAAVFDRDANRVLLYGGEYCRAYLRGVQPIPLNPDLWELSLNVGGYTWQKVQVDGSIPPGRFSHSATLTLDRSLFVFGGTANGTANFATTYKFRPTDPPIPEARARHVTVYDPIRQRMILWGGDDGYRLFKDDIWSMSLQPGTAPSWSKLKVRVQGDIPFFGTRGAAAVFDTRRGVMYVHGGAPVLNTNPVPYFLQLNFPAADSAVWSQPTTLAGDPGSRMFHSMAYDSVGDRLYIYGGWDGYGGLNTTMRMTPTQNGMQWAEVAAPPNPNPGARYGHASFFDTADRRLVIMGGEGNPSGGGSIGPVYGLSVSGTPAWAQINSFGGPGNLWFASAAYRNYGERAYVTGGWFDPINVWSNEPIGIYWLYDDPVFQSGWGQYQLTGAPSNHLYQNTSIFDRLGNRVIRFGGSRFAGQQQTHPYDKTPTNVMNLSYALATPDWVYDSSWSQIALYGVAVAGGGGGGGGGGKPRKDLVDQVTPVHGGDPQTQVLVRGGLASTPVRFRIDGTSGNAALVVRLFDVRGRLVQTVGGTTSEVTWDRNTRSGLRAAPGVYVYRATAGNGMWTGKVVLTR